ncbi:MAG: hypothetical protein O2877_01770 [bacterium]|nr:hypothetical protein [bacterium]
MSAITLRHYKTTMSVLKRDPIRAHRYKEQSIDYDLIHASREKLRATIRSFITSGI